MGGFEWAPDSKRIAISAEAPEPKAMKDRKESFGEYHVIHADYEMAHLWLVDLPKTDEAGRVSAVGEPKLLTQGRYVQRGAVFVFAGWDADCVQRGAGSGSDFGVFEGHLRGDGGGRRGEEDCRYAGAGFRSAVVAGWEADRIFDVERGEVFLLYEPEDCGGGCGWRNAAGGERRV